MAKDRYHLDLFHTEAQELKNFLTVQEINDSVYTATALYLELLAADFPYTTSLKYRKVLVRQWLELLPTLKSVNKLYIRHPVDQDFFEAICKMKGLEQLYFCTSIVENLSSIIKLQNLKLLQIDSFSRLKDISPVVGLKNLQLLSIVNSFKIENYECISEMSNLTGLNLNGDPIAPRNLRLPSLQPFGKLKKLRHLDISYLSVVDKSYETIIEMESLERLDLTITIPKAIRDLIKSKHKSLESGLFMDWDWENNKIQEGKEW